MIDNSLCLASNENRYILQDDMCTSTAEKHKVYQALFGPAYLALVDCLLTKSMITIDQSEWSPDDKETFRCYRQVYHIVQVDWST